jgi:hypothetical protein
MEAVMSRNQSSVVFLGFAAMAAVACPLAAGCMAAENDGSVSNAFDVPLTAMTGSGDPEDPPESHNPMYPICFWNHGTQQTYRDLAGGALANAQGQLPNMPHMALTSLHPLLRTICRTQSLDYLIRCALPQNTTVTDPASGATYEGHFGIAPEWATGALSSANEEWITSCLVQHLNGYYSTTPLVLEGNRPGFYIGTVASGYPYFDSIAWGNLFDPSQNSTLDPAGWNTQSRPAFIANVCYFNSLDLNCTSAPAAVEERVCDSTGDSCGLVDRGRCETTCTWNTRNGAYSPTATWSCDGKTSNFRERLPTLDMYGFACDLPE